MNKIMLIFEIFILTITIKLSVSDDQSVHEREKRFLTFPEDSATGILCAIAIPLDLPHRTVFVTYNFEANYGMPEEASDYIPGVLDRLDIIDRGLGRKNTEGALSSSNETDSDRQLKNSENAIAPQKRSVKDPFFSRRKIYKTMESKLKSHGHSGRPCLLRAICEEAENPMHDHNGVIGDIIHIILTPSTSNREDLHPEYYKAEELGRSGDCSKYKKYCPQCILDYISQFKSITPSRNMKISNFLTILFVFTIISFTSSAKLDKDVTKEREKRWLAFPLNSATGVLVALAIPLIIPHRNVFVSYNFEANYNMPTVASDLIPGPLDRLEIIDRSMGDKISEYQPISSKQSRSLKEPLFSRKKIYNVLESKLRCHGHRGRACLLRAICEEAEDPIHDHNGVIGDIIHIILTPSSSVQEDLHPEYYKAEELGRSGDCTKYKKYCPQCIHDYISKVFEL
ncbi:hypothetical protein DMENIID0001_030390 [Sergentomyia squamirostris]